MEIYSPPEEISPPQLLTEQLPSLRHLLSPVAEVHLIGHLILPKVHLKTPSGNPDSLPKNSRDPMSVTSTHDPVG